MSGFTCPLCRLKDNKCKKAFSDRNGYMCFHCDTFGVDYAVSDNIMNLPPNEKMARLFDLMTEFLLHKTRRLDESADKKVWHFDFDVSTEEQGTICQEYVNLATLLNNYPTTVMERADRAIYNLSLLFPQYGDVISLFPDQSRIIFEHNPNNADTNGTLDILQELGYLNAVSSGLYKISAEGWKKIDQMRSKEFVKKQAFVAMKFGEQTNKTREAIRTAIQQCGYTARIIDEKEHNNQIVPEIFYEIEQSIFLVVDLTIHCDGAYYEAGYAQGLGKQVIVCCRAKEFESTPPHFDIAQKSMVVWKDEADLINRLQKRIVATVF